jgi:hypothetical protein
MAGNKAMERQRTALLVMAAGMGSRYGGIKQLEGLGPGGEAILEYSVFDAVRAGFDKLVFVIREELETDFRRLFLDRINPAIPVELVFQDNSKLPPPWEGGKLAAHRSKPWGTAHAVWCAGEVLKHPFAVINADDFYGRRSFEILHDWLVSADPGAARWAMVGYQLGKTLSDKGPVARGICELGGGHRLLSVVEHTKLAAADPLVGTVTSTQPDGSRLSLDPLTLVSMNFFGFTTVVFPELERALSGFLAARGGDPVAECYLPAVVGSAIGAGRANMDVLESPESWFGITWREDREDAASRIKLLVERAVYPSPLWGAS